jgi:hypothetical protein
MTLIMNRIILLLIALAIASTARSQVAGATFKAGLSFSRLDGPSEVDGNGRELEDFTFATGFHIAGGVNLKFAESFGMRAEVMYSQKGGNYTYDGQSFWIFFTQSGSEIYAVGNRRTVLSITNSYIDLPVMVYYRAGRIELSAGVNAAILASSRGGGELTFSGVSLGGTTIDPFTIALDFNDFKDAFQRADIDDFVTRVIDNQVVEIPISVGSQYAALGREGNLYNSFDLGLNAGLAFFLNQGLYLGFRLNYGLLDVTKNDQDISRLELNPENSFIQRNDFDRNVSLQASIGFSF